jgi:hypothetical protein
VKQRLKRNSNTSLLGQKSPMQAIEPYLVAIIIKLANMRIPITTAQGLQLANSLINGTRFKEEVHQFEKLNLRSASSELGRGYWRGFLKQNKNLIEAMLNGALT